MFCPNCGTDNPEENFFCSNCDAELLGDDPRQPGTAPPPQQYSGTYVNPPQGGQQANAPQQPQQYGGQPPPGQYGQQSGGYGNQQPGGYNPIPPNTSTTMLFGILTLLFCCLIGGIISLLCVSEANRRIAFGDFAGAEQSVKTATMWIWISIASNAVWWVLYFAFFAAMFAGMSTY